MKEKEAGWIQRLATIQRRRQRRELVQWEELSDDSEDQSLPRRNFWSSPMRSDALKSASLVWLSS